MIQNMWLRYASHEGAVIVFSKYTIMLSNFGCQEHQIGKDSVTVVEYPLGGDRISVTKGVVSRVEV